MNWFLKGGESIFRRLSFIILIVMTLFACSKEDHIEIGLVADISSGKTIFGSTSRNAIEMAINEVNRTGGINGKTVQLSVGDNVNNPDNNAEIIQNFYEKGINIVIGPFLSRMAPSVLEASENKDMLVISPNVTSDLFAGLDDNFIRILPNASTDGKQIGKAVFERGDKTAALIRSHSNDLYTQWFMKGVRSVLEEKGIEILYDYAFPDNDDLLGIAEELLSLSPDALIFSSLGKDAGTIIQQYGKYKEIPHLYGDEWAKNSHIATHSGRFAQSLIIVNTVNVHEDLSLEKEFQEKYHNLYSEYPVPYAAFSYEIIYMIKKAIESIGSDFSPDDLKAYFLSMKDFYGIMGHLEFNEYGDSQRFKKLYIYMNNEYVAY